MKYLLVFLFSFLSLQGNASETMTNNTMVGLCVSNVCNTKNYYNTVYTKNGIQYNIYTNGILSLIQLPHKNNKVCVNITSFKSIDRNKCSVAIAQINNYFTTENKKFLTH
jgi:hypothetical protein